MRKLALYGLLIIAMMTGSTAMAGSITVSGVWARATVATNPGAVFLTITSTGDADRLIGAETPVSRVTEIHSHVMEDGIMRMRKVDAIEIGAKATVDLKPGAFHIMLLEPVKPLVKGDHFPLTLTFEKAGRITVTAMVMDIGAQSAPHDMEHMH